MSDLKKLEQLEAELHEENLARKLSDQLEMENQLKNLSIDQLNQLKEGVDNQILENRKNDLVYQKLDQLAAHKPKGQTEDLAKKLGDDQTGDQIDDETKDQTQKQSSDVIKDETNVAAEGQTKDEPQEQREDLTDEEDTDDQPATGHQARKGLEEHLREWEQEENELNQKELPFILKIYI